MYLNPAFTGLTYEHRFIANYRNQWPGISKAFQTYMASYDYNMTKLNSGIGLNIMQDRAGTAGLTHTQLGLNYAYRFKIFKSSEIRMGTTLSYNLKKLDFNKLIFNDQINSGSTTSIEASSYEQLSFLDISAGALLNSTKYWLGFSAKHLNQPNTSFIGYRSPIPITFSLHGGYKFILEQESEDLKRYISPTLNYRRQEKYDQLDIGVYYYHLPLSFGLWYRGLPLKRYSSTYNNRESLAFLFGFDLTKYNIRAGYSFDFTISKLGINNSRGAHEISIIFEINRESKKDKKVMISYPKF